MPDRKVRRWLRRRDERGAIILLATVGIVVAMMAAGLAVDAGTLAVEARTNQRVADLAAIDAIRVLPVDPTVAAQQSATRNNFPWADTAHGYQLTVEWGNADPVTGVVAFGTDSAKLSTATQVRVTATSPHKNQFAFSTASQSVARKAAAGIGNPPPCPPLPYVCVKSDGTPIGTVRVGSTAASLTSSDSVILNRLLTNTVGGSYTTNAVGWQGIASGAVTFSRLRTALGYSAGTTDQVLDANLTYRQLLDATVSALNADGSPSSVAAATPLALIAAQVSAAAGTTFQLRKLLDITGNVGGGADVADATINIRDIVVGGMTLADTDHFATFNLTAADIPGLPGTGVTVKFGLIEAPQQKSGPPKDGSGVYRTIAHTSQIRLLVEANVNVNVGSGVTLALKVPYYIEGASADAKLDTMTCPAGSATPSSVTIFGETQVATSYVGSVTDAGLGNTAVVPVPGNTTLASANVSVLAGLATVTVTATTTGPLASVSAAGHSGLVTFTAPYDGTTSQAIPGSTTLGLPSVTTGNVDVTVTGSVAGILNLNLNVAAAKTAIVNAISPLVAPLTTNVITPLTRALGLSVANGDIWAPAPQKCNPVSFNVGPPGTAPLVPALVQ